MLSGDDGLRLDWLPDKERKCGNRECRARQEKPAVKLVRGGVPKACLCEAHGRNRRAWTFGSPR
jgi:hypothetical protein